MHAHCGPKAPGASAGALVCAVVLAAGALVSGGGAAAASSVPFAVPKDDRPAWIGPSPARTPFDCSGAIVVTIAAGKDSLEGTTVGQPNRNAGYTQCVAWDESGGEVVYRLDVTQDVILSVSLEGLTADLDIFLLSGCDGDACLAGASNAFALQVAPASYFLVVDGYQEAAGPYRLIWRAFPAGVPASICAGGARPVTCGSEPFTPTDATVWEAPNLIETAACSPFLEEGGEAWYAVTLADSSSFKAKVSGQTFDAALWLFDGCGPDAVCLGFADWTAGGGAETLAYHNPPGGRRTVYLAVDALRPPDAVYNAGFKLRIDCSKAVLVPVRRASWGTVKALYGADRPAANRPNRPRR